MLFGQKNHSPVTIRDARRPKSRLCVGRGFTLIEILVVVAIIALLIAILLPSLKQAREQARKVVCGTTQRTISQAMMLYGAANKDFFPYDDFQATAASRGPTGLSNVGLNCWEFFHRYIQKSIPTHVTDLSRCPYAAANMSSPTFWNVMLDWYLCPSDEIWHCSNLKKSGLPNGATQINYMLSYCIAANIPWDFNTSSQVVAIRKMSSIQRPSAKMIIAEFGDDSKSLERASWSKHDRNGAPEYLNQSDTFQIRHLSGGNIVYLDGHIQFHKFLDGRRGPPNTGGYPWFGLPTASAASFEDIAVYDRTKPPEAPGLDPATGTNRITDRADPIP